MLHPHTELAFIDDRIGYGVVATRRIPRGTITWVLDELDQRIPPHRVRRLSTLQRKHLDKYAYVDREGNWVLCWDHGRYVNHSCAASCISLYDFSMALRDIQPGEQVTDDYGSLNLDESFTCWCDTTTCRGEVGPDDFLRFADVWDRSAADVLPLLATVQQPLWSLVQEKDAVRAALSDPLALPSCRESYFTPVRAARPRRRLRAAAG
jgi:hypothetical protein